MNARRRTKPFLPRPLPRPDSHDSLCLVDRYLTTCTDSSWAWTLFLQATGLATLSWPTSSLSYVLQKVT